MDVRVPLFREHPSLRPPDAGALFGRRVVVIAAPLGCGIGGVLKVARSLHRRGVFVALASECHGEVSGERRRYLHPNLLAVEVHPREWDAVVFAGGPGAATLAEDAFARSLGKDAAAAGRFVGGVDEGAALVPADERSAKGAPLAVAAALLHWLAHTPRALV
jgi:putative intracellular protease/amidase